VKCNQEKPKWLEKSEQENTEVGIRKKLKLGLARLGWLTRLTANPNDSSQSFVPIALTSRCGSRRYHLKNGVFSWNCYETIKDHNTIKDYDYRVAPKGGPQAPTISMGYSIRDSIEGPAVGMGTIYLPSGECYTLTTSIVTRARSKSEHQKSLNWLVGFEDGTLGLFPILPTYHFERRLLVEELLTHRSDEVRAFGIKAIK
jgi:hypothetical protein